MTPFGYSRPFNRWWFAALAGAAAAFIVYGSYVPFEWRARPWAEVKAAFSWAVQTRATPDSRSDWLANVALGAPLGFALLGLFRLDKPGVAPAVVVGMAVVPACTVFAAAVEFGQLYCVGRTCSGSDIWAQGLGALIGAGVWIARGQWATDRLRAALGADTVRSSTAPLVAGYAIVLILIQTLPLDLTASPYQIYKRLSNPEQVTLVPFDELADSSGRRGGVSEFKKVADWLELVALFLPAGLLATGLPGRFRSINGLFAVFGWGLLAAAVTESLQVLVMSRHGSTTDGLVGGCAFTLGWVIGRILADRGMRKYRLEAALALGQVWVAALAVVHWQPFEFYPQLLAPKVRSADWMPLASQAAKNYLWALNEVASKFVLYVPLGAVVVWGSVRHDLRSRVMAAMVVGGVVATVLELGQGMLPGRHFGPSDILFGVIGAGAGGAVTRRVLGAATVRQRVRLRTTAPPVPIPAVTAPPAPVLPPPAPGEPWWAAAERQYSTGGPPKNSSPSRVDHDPKPG